MPKRAFIFTALFTVLGTLLYGQTPTFVFSPGTLPDALYGSAYAGQTFMVTGGTAPYTFSVSAGSPPPGMSLSTAGVLSGTPTTAGTYSFTVTAVDNSPAPGPYSGNQTYTLVVDQAALSISANNASMTYGGTVPALTVSYTGFVNGDNASSLTAQPTISTPATSASPVGPYSITPSGALDPNYNITYGNGTLTINPAALTITANNASMTYGGTVPAFTFAYAGFVNGDNASSLTAPPTAATTATSASPVGPYAITPSGASDPNYNISYANGTLTINPAALTITANNATMTYGGVVPAFSVSYTGFVNGDNASRLTTQPTVSTPATSASPAGPYAITPTGASDPNYNISYTNGTLTINPATLTITANNTTMTYGGTVPALTASYAGFLNGDNASSLTTQPSVSTTATPASPAGTYPITASGAADPNYTFTYQAGTMTVGKASLTVTANNETVPLGGPLPSLTVSFSGFVNSDNASSLTSQPTATTTAHPNSPAGVYPTTPAGGSSSNYAFTYVSGTLTVEQGVLIITAKPAGSVYGAALAPGNSLMVSYSGFVNGDGPGSLTTPPIVTNTATAGAAAGTYALIPSGAVDPNYTIQYVNGVYTISPAPLMIKANNATMTYGATVPVLTASYTGFVNGDNGTSLTTQPTVATTATSSSPVGTYPITAAGAVDPNYTITYQPGTMTVGKAPLIVTADNQTMPLGGPLPTLTVSYSGFVNGDGPSSLAPLPNATTPANANSPAGTYPIMPHGGASPNYTLSYVNGILSVGKALLTITANNASMTYGGAVPGLTVSYSGFVNGDNASSLTTQPTVSTTAASSSPAGTYSITASGAADPNYVIAYQAGTMTVGKASLTVTADSKSMPLGGPLPALTVSYSGFVNNDNASSLTTQPTATTTATANSPAGAYQIKVTGGSSANYTFNYVSGILTVATAVLTVTANPAGSVYGAALVPGGSLTVSYSGFANGDGPGSLTVQPTVTNTAFAGAPAGSYTLIPSGAVDPNYLIQYVNGMYTITPAPLKINAMNQAMVYGGTLPSLGVAYAGFVNGDNASKLTTAPTVTTTAAATSPAGSYPITASGAIDPNYSISYTPGTLTISPAALHITANAQTKAYGTPDPALTYAVGGLVNGDNANVVTGTLARAPGEGVGTYPITEGTLSAGGNYSITYTGNNLTITKAQQHISWTQSLLVGCNDTTQVHLNAVASSGLPVTYSVSDPNIATVSGSVLTLLHPGTAVITAAQAGDSNNLAATAVTDTLVYQSSSLLTEHWNDALFFDNSSGNYVAWQWYKDGQPVAGATGPFYSDTPTLNGQYYVIATNKDGQQIESCTLNITGSTPIPGGIKVYPNPASAGAVVTVTSNYPSAALQGAVLQLVEINGNVRQKFTNVQPSMQVTMPSDTGIYVINLQLASGERASVNVLVVD